MSMELYYLEFESIFSLLLIKWLMNIFLNDLKYKFFLKFVLRKFSYIIFDFWIKVYCFCFLGVGVRLYFLEFLIKIKFVLYINSKR